MFLLRCQIQVCMDQELLKFPLCCLTARLSLQLSYQLNQSDHPPVLSPLRNKRSLTAPWRHTPTFLSTLIRPTQVMIEGFPSPGGGGWWGTQGPLRVNWG